MTANELEVLNHYNKKMLKYDESPDIIMKCLWKLDRVQVNIALLQNTGIGRTVSALKKKYGESEVGTIAKELVLKWKNVVAKEEEELENEDSEVNETENDDNKNLTPPSSLSQASHYGNSSYGADFSDTPESRTQEESSSTQDEEQNPRRKSKKKKSHRERSEERKSSKREEKEKKAKYQEKEKSRKHKSSEKDRDSRNHSRAKENKTNSQSSVESHSRGSLATKNVKKEKNDSDHSHHNERNKNKSESRSSSSSGKIPQSRSSSGSKSDKSYKQPSPNDLSSIDMFQNVVEDCDEVTRPKKRPTNSDPGEEALNSKRSRMEPPWKASAGMSSLGPSFIPDISPIYKPLPRVNMSVFEKQPTDDRNKDEESLSLLLSNKNKGRAAIYSGEKRKGFAPGTEVPSLFSQCIQVLKDNVDFIEEVGGLGFDILKPVLIMANAETLGRIEDINPHLMADTANLWEKFVQKKFYRKTRNEMESWREMYERCVEEQALKLDALKGRVKQTEKAEKDSHRKTKLAYVDVAPKAPRSIRNAQVKHGTALPSGAPLVAGGPRPRNLIGDPTANSSRAGYTSKKPKTAPLMAKTFKLMRGIKGGFRR